MAQKPKKITVANQHNEKLVGLLHDTGSTEVVVLCHGFKATKDLNTMVNLAVAMEKEGISAFRFDFAGNGESEGKFEYGSYGREVDDLHSVVEYFHGVNQLYNQKSQSELISVVLPFVKEDHWAGFG